MVTDMSKKVVPITSALRHSPYRTPAAQFLHDGGERPAPGDDARADDGRLDDGRADDSRASNDSASAGEHGFRGDAPLFAFGGAIVVLAGMIFAALPVVLVGITLFVLAFRRIAPRRAPFALRLMPGGASPADGEPEEDGPGEDGRSRRLGDSIVTRG